MRKITKGREPGFLAAQRSTPAGCYAALSGTEKDEIRAALAAEQGFLCAYCLSRIDPHQTHNGNPVMRIEHHSPQSVAPERDLVWSNLLGSCDGGGDVAPGAQSCDRAKANNALKLHPASWPTGLPDEIFRHLFDGSIETNDLYNADISVLNLNTSRLKKARRAVYDAVLAVANKHRADPSTLRRIRKDWDGLRAGKLRPHLQTALYLLDRRIQAADSKQSALGRREL